MKICVIGTGYVGLVTGACFAAAGNTVYCVDVDEQKVAKLKEGIIPIYEPGLKPHVVENYEKGRLIFTTDLAEGINNSDIAFIAVGTPQDEDGSADLKYVFQVCEDICRVATKKVIVGTKSTVPVGTGDKIEALFADKLKQDYVVFSNPEFLKEGDAVRDFMKPDRVIVGCDDDEVIELLKELYAPFTHQRERLIVMTRKSAEITKYAANSMLALRISFMNELANFCDEVGGNIHDVRVGIGSDPRIGPHFLYSSLGFGGSCFPKDVSALLRVGRDEGMELKTLAALQDVNDNQPVHFAGKIAQSFGGAENLKGKKLAVWGLAFKARTDDIRYSPALKLIDQLLEWGVDVHVSDPKALENTKRLYETRLTYHEDMMQALKDADGLILATEWNEFKSPDFEKICSLLKSNKIFDGRNIYSRHKLEKMGIEYVGIGT